MMVWFLPQSFGEPQSHRVFPRTRVSRTNQGAGSGISMERLYSHAGAPPCCNQPASSFASCKGPVLMFAVSEVLSQILGSDRLAEMAERVAGRSRLGVWQRVMHRLPALGPTEARGYL